MECVKFLSQRRSGAVLMECTHKKIRQINRAYIRKKEKKFQFVFKHPSLEKILKIECSAECRSLEVECRVQKT